MRAESEHTDGRWRPDAVLGHQSAVNWGLLVGLLGCLSFWCAVAFGIVAAI